MKFSSWIVVGAAAASVGLAACESVLAQPAPAAPAPAVLTPNPATHAKATYERLCFGCHEAEIVEAQRHTKSEWDETVHSMADRGLTATEAEMAEVIDYLAMKLPPQAPPK